VYLFVERYLRLVEERADMRQRLGVSERELVEARTRQSTVLRISQMFLEAGDEDEVVELTIRLACELLGARAASFVPLDENAQPMEAKSQGDMPFTEASTWLEYLASPGVREACAACQQQEQLIHTCPLLKGSFENTAGVYCIPLRREGQELGILNLFLPSESDLEPEAGSLLRILVDEATIALESVRMRQRAMTTLQQLQSLRARTDLNGLLKDLMASLQDTLEADFVLVFIRDSETPEASRFSIGSEPPENTRHLIDGVLQSVMTSREPVLLENVAGGLAPSGGVRAILAAPLLVQELSAKGTSLGAILASSQRTRAFNQRQLSILQLIAGQIALIVQNVRLVAQLEYKTVIEERMRLAREIHDGLAQTLGFLKLKTAQMRTFMEQGEHELLREAVEQSYNVLDEAYQDARQAIDGLRVSSKEGFAEWLQQTVDEFMEYTGAEVSVCEPGVLMDLPPEVSAQLIRIIQEALSNVRKHAHAQRVDISCHRTAEAILIEISDSGRGFNVEDVPGPSQHGLRGMRERAELIGAELQVISQPEHGTSVRLRLPLQEKERLP
jgi:two-component system nitrate/nitrite sensor histidine kinase NarX